MIIWFISAMLRFAITGAADVNRSGDWPWMRRLSGWSFRPSSRIVSRWRSALLNNSNAKRRCLNDSGRCGSSGRAMKRRGRERQYEMCEPENRLVARNLERLWETRLRVVEEAEQEFEAWRRQNGTLLTDEDRRQILALGEDLRKLWAAPTSTNADRKQIIRLIIKEVVLDQKRERGKLWFKINDVSVYRMRKCWGIRANRQCEDGRNPQKWEDETYSVQGAATVIGVKASAVHRWLRGGLLDARQSGKGGAWKIRLTAEQISCLREYAQQPQSGRRRKTLLMQLAAGANPSERVNS